MKNLLKLLACMLFVITANPLSAYPVTSLYIESISDPDIVPKRLIDESTNGGTVFRGFALNNTSFNRGAVSFSISGPGNAWNVGMLAPYGRTLEIREYGPAVRYPSSGFLIPEFNFSGNGVGCNKSTSKFRILEADYEPGISVTSFAIDFVHHCSSHFPRRTFGSLRFNSSLPISLEPTIAIPMPPSLILSFSSLVGLGLLWRKRQS